MTNKYTSGEGLEHWLAILGNSSDFHFPATWLKHAFAMVATVTCPSNREGSGQPRGAPGCPVLLVAYPRHVSSITCSLQHSVGRLSIGVAPPWKHWIDPNGLLVFLHVALPNCFYPRRTNRKTAGVIIAYHCHGATLGWPGEIRSPEGALLIEHLFCSMPHAHSPRSNLYYFLSVNDGLL